VVVGKGVRAVFSGHILKVQPATGVERDKLTDIVNVRLDDNPAIFHCVVLRNFFHRQILSKRFILSTPRSIELLHIHGFSLLLSPDHTGLGR